MNSFEAKKWEIERMIEFNGHARYGFHRYDLSDHALKMQILKANRPAASRFAKEYTYGNVMTYFFKKRLDIIEARLSDVSDGDKIIFYMHFNKPIGFGYVKGDNLECDPKPTEWLTVVLRKTEFVNMLGFQLVTAYPDMEPKKRIRSA